MTLDITTRTHNITHPHRRIKGFSENNASLYILPMFYVNNLMLTRETKRDFDRENAFIFYHILMQGDAKALYIVIFMELCQ